VKADLCALAQHLLPMSDAEASALGVGEWLKNAARLPEPIRAYFWEQVATASQVFLPADEWDALQGSREWDRWDVAIGAHFARRRAAQAQTLAEAALDQYVTMDRDVMGGMPCFAGTRVPVAFVIASIDRGMSIDEVRTHYEFVTDVHVWAGRAYIQAHPERFKR
jgi:uncharacterized protein (DUF433 family)